MNNLGPADAYWQMTTAQLKRAFIKADKAGDAYASKHGSIGNRQRRIAEDIALVLRQRGILTSDFA